jgi:hypothetical protein
VYIPWILLCSYFLCEYSFYLLLLFWNIAMFSKESLTILWVCSAFGWQDMDILSRTWSVGCGLIIGFIEHLSTHLITTLYTSLLHTLVSSNMIFNSLLVIASNCRCCPSGFPNWPCALSAATLDQMTLRHRPSTPSPTCDLILMIITLQFPLPLPS